MVRRTIFVWFCNAFVFRKILSRIRFLYDLITRTISVRFCHAYDCVLYAYGANTIAIITRESRVHFQFEKTTVWLNFLFLHGIKPHFLIKYYSCKTFSDKYLFDKTKFRLLVISCICIISSLFFFKMNRLNQFHAIQSKSSTINPNISTRLLTE